MTNTNWKPEETTITLNGETFTINPDPGDLFINSNDCITSSSTIDISSLTVDTIDIDWNSEISIDYVEFEDCMPEVAKIEDMCKDYPALQKAYENFKTIYNMVHQDWQGKQDKDEGLPF